MSTINPNTIKINYEPFILGYSLFQCVKNETGIKGYWKDREGKLFIDNIKLRGFSIICKDRLEACISIAFREGEEAVMYRNEFNEAVIVFKEGSKIILKNQIHIVENEKPSHNYIMELLKNHEGLTIYNTYDNKFLIELYK